MKNKILLIITLAFCNIYAQKTTVKINFDNYVSATDNDLKNNFYSYPSNYKLVNNPDGAGKVVRNEWSSTAADNMKLCNKFKSVLGDTLTVSLDYKYKVLFNNYNSYRNSVGIFMFNNKGVAILSNILYEQNLYLSPSNSTSSDNSGTLVKDADGKWYRLTLQVVTRENSNLRCISKVYDLGVDGKSVPSLVKSYIKEGTNYDYTTKDGFSIGLLGFQYGNIYCLDNIEIEGYESGTNCTNTSLGTEDVTFDNMKIYPNPTNGKIYFENTLLENAVVYDSFGRKVKVFMSNELANSEIDLSGLQKGIYYLDFESNGNHIKRKIILE